MTPGASGDTPMPSHAPIPYAGVTTDMDPALRQSLAELQAQGLALGACGNTMKGLNVTLEQLPAGAKALPQGGVVRVMELQERGSAYLRP